MTTHRPAYLAQRGGPGGRLGRVHSIGLIEGGRGMPTDGRPRAYDRYALVYVWRGSGRYRDREHNLALAQGDLVYVLPGHPRWYGVPGRGTWNEIFVVFDGPVFDLCAAQGLLDAERPVRRLDPVDHWHRRLDAFRTRRPPTTAAGADQEACELVQLLIDLAARGAGSAHPYPRSTSWLEESKARLGAELAEPLDLATVAAAVGMPYETWRKRITAMTGHPPARYRLLQRIESASVLLRRTSLTNRDIAASLGFSDEHHLARQFRRTTGMTTTEYRRTLA